jgi:hypothetical protein
MVIANGSLSMYQRFGNPNYQGGSPQREPSAQYAAGRMVKPQPEKAVGATLGAAPPSGATHAHFSYLPPNKIESYDPTRPAVADSVEESSAQFSDPPPPTDSQGSSANDPTMTAFWLNADTISPLSPPLDGGWMAQSNRDFTAMYRQCAVTSGTNYCSPTATEAPTQFPGGMSVKGTLDSITAPGMPAKDAAIPDGNFANYEGILGGKQEFSIGDSMEVGHGNKWEYRKGNGHEFKDGNKFEFDLSGYTVGYSWDKLEISYGKGTSTEIGYFEGKTEFCYISGNSSAYERFDGDKTEESSVNSSYVTEIVRDLARETSHIARKEEYSAVGGSVGLSVGGPSFELSANAKIEIETAAKVEVYAGALAEITLALKCEINPFTVFKIGAEKTEAEEAENKFSVLKNEVSAMKTDLYDVQANSSVCKLVNVQAEIKNAIAELKKTNALLNSTMIAVETGSTFII